MSGKLRAAFRADAGAAIGGGHVFRCQSLAAAMRARGWTTLLATSRETLAFVPQAAAAFDRVVEIGAPGAADEAAAAGAVAGPADALVIDHYGRDAAFESACRDWARVIATFDDRADRAHSADLVVDVTPGREPAAYRGKAGDAARLLLGPAFAPLRASWAEARPPALTRDRAGPVRRISVSLGAIDAQNATGFALEALAACAWKGEVVAVVGSGAPHRTALAAFVAARRGWRLLVDPPDYTEVIAQSDLAIGAAGTSTWERCCVGLPSIVLELAENQADNIAALSAAGAARVAGALRSLSTAELARAIDALVADGPGRAAMSARAAALCDGRGADRIADAIERALAAAPAMRKVAS
jgi:UDP-2,4-diacetamido-2,4,6-trideoxy-beta-L-altropyranose hydrolase